MLKTKSHVRRAGGKVKHRLVKQSDSGAVAGSLFKSFAKFRESMGVTQAEMARLTGYSIRSIASWEAGRIANAAAVSRFTSIFRLCGALANIMPKESVGEWLGTSNSAFEGQTPMQIIERGESDRLWLMVHQMEGNVAN